MSFLQLVLSLDKTKDGFNSIMENLSIWPISQQPVFGDSKVKYIERTHDDGADMESSTTI